jgi:hypothetical protein
MLFKSCHGFLDKGGKFMDIVIFTLKSLAYALTEPSLAIVLVILGFILHSQNKKTAVMQKMIIGESINSPMELTISQIVMGILGGVIASIILTYCGVMFDQSSGIELLFMISVVLMFWNPRFICFSYSGAVLGFISIVLNNINPMLGGKAPVQSLFNVDIVALMTLVAVLHIVEGILIMLDGSRGHIPVFANRDNKIIGGFAFKRYWPLPMVLLFLMRGSDMGLGETVNTPDWWPLINLSYTAEFLKAALVVSVPLYGVMGYSSVTFTKSKSEKTLLSGVSTLTYGVLLSFVAQTAAYGLAWKLLVLAFAPLAHEAMLRLQKYYEVKSAPKYNSEDEGLVVLEVAPGSPAWEMGLESGDKLIEINDNKIITERDIFDSITGTINYIWFKVIKANGIETQVNYTNLSRERRIGIVFVPKSVPSDSKIVRFEEDSFREMLDKIKNRDKDEE